MADCAPRTHQAGPCFAPDRLPFAVEVGRTVYVVLTSPWATPKICIVTVPTHEYTRRFGESTINIWNEWPKVVWSLIRSLLQPGCVDASRTRRG